MSRLCGLFLCAFLLLGAWAGVARGVECPAGQAVAPHTAGHCCWAGQAWNGERCVGVPSGCPAGLTADAEAQGCVPPACREGQKRPDGAHCCWPGQAWRDGRCQGAPQCPAGLMVAEGACAPEGMVRVPAGPFRMGCAPDDARCEADERPAGEVWLDEFWIDRTEVTLAAYTRCIAAGACTDPDTEEHCNWPRGYRADHPVNCVTWFQAAAYCRWAGKRLPTEAEWEKAARGSDGRPFPWGAEPPSCERAVVRDAEGSACGRDHTWPVGSKPAGASPYGALDMAGNVWEWVADRYDAAYYARRPDRNPAGPRGISPARVCRGGSYDFAGRHARATGRYDLEVCEPLEDVGFRCAW